jgi:hypothetical protein
MRSPKMEEINTVLVNVVQEQVNEADLLAIEQRANAATPGPWETREDGDYYQGGTYIGVEPYHYPGPKPGRPEKFPDHCYFKTDVCRVESGEADREFILHARTDVPALIAEVRRLQHRIAERERSDEEFAALHGFSIFGRPSWTIKSDE